ncbi:MAG TPA: GNAT family N-acetyltransferase, partial [Chloroflexota bacterium]|nr:GNAT family N-acetyltransferase [Chloroflexota bacterium]
MSTIIRQATAQEAPDILRLTQEAFAAHRDLLDPPSGVLRETLADVIRALSEGAIYVALRHDVIVGAARIHALEQPVALYCGRLAVSPSAWHSGVGTALMVAVERHAHQEG